MTHSLDALQDPTRLADLRTKRIGQTVRTYGTVTSTNDVALEWAAGGAPDGAVVFSEYQEKGRGRLGRSWKARAGLNLMLSVILRPSVTPDRWSLIALAASLAVADALDEVAPPLRAQIKWPNDVLLEGKKCCGMLLESRSAGRRGDATVVLGIGLNVNQDRFPPELEESATSILLATGRRVPRENVYRVVLENLERELDALPDDASWLRRRYLGRMRGLSEEVQLRFTEQGGEIRGIVTGLSDTGGLILSTDDGMQVYHAGEVTMAY